MGSDLYVVWCGLQRWKKPTTGKQKTRPTLIIISKTQVVHQIAVYRIFRTFSLTAQGKFFVHLSWSCASSSWVAQVDYRIHSRSRRLAQVSCGNLKGLARIVCCRQSHKTVSWTTVLKKWPPKRQRTSAPMNSNPSSRARKRSKEYIVVLNAILLC